MARATHVPMRIKLREPGIFDKTRSVPEYRGGAYDPDDEVHPVLGLTLRKTYFARVLNDEGIMLELTLEDAKLLQQQLESVMVLYTQNATTEREVQE